jgi:hypothetical protein
MACQRVEQETLRQDGAGGAVLSCCHYLLGPYPFTLKQSLRGK